MNQLRKTDLILIGGSSGAVEAVMKIISKLDKRFTIPIVVVLHQERKSRNLMVDILQHRTKLKVKEPLDKELILTKHIYIAPPDFHLLIEPDFSFGYSFSEPVNFSRPAIDVLFESAADSLKENVTGILLTGANNDGARGMCRIKKMGGYAIIQDPLEAEFPVMPKSASDLCAIDLTLKIADISKELNNTNYGRNTE